MSKISSVLSNGFVLFDEDGKGYTLRDTKGNILGTALYDEIILHDVDREKVFYWVRKGDKLGIIDINGNELLPPIYEEIGRNDRSALVRDWNSVDTPIFPVKRDSKWTFVRNTDFKEICPLYTMLLSPFNNGYAIVKNTDQQLIVINEDGKELWNVKTQNDYKWARFLAEHYAVVRKDEFHTFYKILNLETDKVIFEAWYDINFMWHNEKTKEVYFRVSGDPYVITKYGKVEESY